MILKHQNKILENETGELSDIVIKQMEFQTFIVSNTSFWLRSLETLRKPLRQDVKITRKQKKLLYV